MHADANDDCVEAALSAARARGLYVIVRIQELRERRLVVVDGGIERQRTSRMTGVSIHALTPDGSVGFASVDDVTPGSVREAVLQAGALAEAARSLDAERASSLADLESSGTIIQGATPISARSRSVTDLMQAVVQAQEAISDVDLGEGRTVRTTVRDVAETWRVARSDGTDFTFHTPRATMRHDLSGRVDGTMTPASSAVSGAELPTVVAPESLARLARRVVRSAADARLATNAPAIPTGSYRIVMRHALAKGLAHEAIGHLCESDVDGSVLMRGGRLRLGERVAPETVSIVDGPLPGDYAQQPISANGLPRQTVQLVDHGTLRNGLGDLFSAAKAGVPITGACRVASFRDRPTPRMTNIRIEIADALPLDLDPDDLTPEDVLATVRRLGLLDRGQPTVYLAGYRGGMAHPRRGDFAFGTDAAFDLLDGCTPYAPASFSGLAERALASILAGIGPLCTDAIGTCTKDGSGVTSSGGSHALLVLEADPDLVISAAR